MVFITLKYQFPKNYVFIISNNSFVSIDWGDGTQTTVTHDLPYSFHKYTSESIYTVIFNTPTPIPYTWFTYPDSNNGSNYIINCPNAVPINDNVKIHYSFNEQGNASDRIKKLKDQTIYSSLKKIPKTYSNYESLFNISKGYLYCNFDSVYVFQ